MKKISLKKSFILSLLFLSACSIFNTSGSNIENSQGNNPNNNAQVTEAAQVQDNLKTFNAYQNLNDQELAIVQTVADTLHSRTKNGCTGCAYCMPCPFGVNIPNNFRYWR